MALITENKLKSTLDLPIALPATTLKQGDWIVVSTAKIAAGQRLSLRYLTFQLLEATVSGDDIGSANKVIANLGFAYVVMRQNYVSGSPGVAGALDTLVLPGIGIISRASTPLFVIAAGYYSIIVVNNMQASTASAVSTSTDIDFKVSLTGMLRLELIGV